MGPHRPSASVSKSGLRQMMHRCGILPEQYAPFGVDESAGRKLLAAAVGRGETDLRSVRGVRRAVLEAVESATSALPLRVLRREAARDGFLKYDQAITAARILSHPAGGQIDARAITVSTAGIVPAIRRFTAEGHKFRLAVSLTHAVPRMRKLLMPIESTHPTGELVSALHD